MNKTILVRALIALALTATGRSNPLLCTRCGGTKRIVVAPAPPEFEPTSAPCPDCATATKPGTTKEMKMTKKVRVENADTSNHKVVGRQRNYGERACR